MAAAQQQLLIVIVTGYRLFTDYTRFCKEVDAALGRSMPSLMVFGDEPYGTDTLAQRYATERKLSSIKFCADVKHMGEKDCIVVSDWKTGHKGAAGPIRNAIMLRYADEHAKSVHVIGFLSSMSKGTKNCLGIATKQYKRFTRTVIPVT